jgi:O-antigen/teichoic acid export membrane protein
LVGVRYRLSDFHWSKLKELLVFGSKSLLQGIATRVETMTDSLIIGAFLGPAMVPFYSIPANLVQYVRTLAQTLSHVFMPVFSELSAVGDNKKRILSLYFASSKYNASIVVLLGLGICLVGSDFIALWIGQEYADEARSIIPILVIFNCLPYLNPLGSRYLTSVNKHGIYAKWGPVCAAINLLLSLLLIDSYGVLGVALASMIVTISIFPINFNAVSKALGFSFNRYFQLVVFPVLLPCLIAVGVYFALDQEITSYVELLYVSGFVGLSYILSFVMFSLTKKERARLFHIISKLGGKIKGVI